MDNFEIRETTFDDVNDIAILEELSFPEDEMASKETIATRQQQAGAYMIVVREEGHLVGFINGTLTTLDYIHHESMSTHESNGSSLVVHSVTIDPKYRRKGLGSKMLLWYIDKIINKQHEVKKILLLTKELLVKFYESCGFEIVKLSDVEHGVDKWYEMTYKINR